MSRWRSFLSIGAAWLLLTVAGGAQNTATILGTVMDQTGAALPGAQVSVTNVDTGITRSATTGRRGEYRFSALAVGTYAVTCTISGLWSSLRRGVTVTIGREAVVDFTLQIGRVSEQVTEDGEVPLIGTTAATLGGVVDSRQMREIPVNARSWIELMPLQTNAVFAEAGASSVTKGFGRKLSISGQRYTSNSFLLDGADMNDSAGVSGSAAETVAGMETVREFRVVTNAYDAAYGRHTGGVISAVTKSGSNQIHGSLFEFLRNDSLDAYKWEDTARAPEGSDPVKPAYVRNQFGGSMGGPLIHDRTFYFGSYEGLREGQGETEVFTVPALALREHVAEGSREISAATKPYFEAYPLPNRGDLDKLLGTYAATNHNITNQDYSTGRIDHRSSDVNSMFGRITVDNSARHRPQFNTSQLARSNSRYATLEQQHIYSPALLGQTLFSFNRTALTLFDIPKDEFPAFLGKSLGSAPDVPGIISIPSLTSLGGDGDNPKVQNQNIFQLKEDLNYTAGTHSLRFGFQFERFQFNQRSELYSGGSFAFSSLDDFLDDRVQSAAFMRPGSDGIRGWRENVAGLYLHDDWNVRPGLTLNLGLRYEFIKVPTEVNGKVATVRDLRDEILYSITDQDTDVGDPYFANPSLKNFAPRIGLAWQPFGWEKTAIRAGFGTYHDLIMPPEYAAAGVGMAPFFSVAETFPCDHPNTPIDFPNMFVSQHNLLIQNHKSKPQAKGFQYYVSQPAVYKWSLDIEQQLTGDLLIDAGYSGSRGTHLVRGAVMLNHTLGMQLPNPNGLGERTFILLNPDGALRNPNFSRMQWSITDGTSDYQAFSLSASKRFRRGFQMQSSYTFSKSTDDTSTSSDPPDYGNSDRRGYGLSKDHGLSSFDVRESWTTSWFYDIPANNLTGAANALLSGWTVSAMLRFNDGFPLNPGALQSRDRVNGILYPMYFVDGPQLDLISGGNQNPIRPQSPDQYVDVSQFMLPATNCLSRDRRFDTQDPFPCDPSLTGELVGPQGAFLGNLGRNVLIAPGLANVDITLIKETKMPILGENSNLQIRAELFNLFNRPNFGVPNLILYGRNGLPQSGGGRIDGTRTNSRQFQVALRLAF